MKITSNGRQPKNIKSGISQGKSRVWFCSAQLVLHIIDPKSGEQKITKNTN
jgi:hypothetical protein